ncbi:MAG: Nre family DNA repair protein [Candidatus Altiarchaeota archaeon]|nr:Nre family DNA repair protein [Candidatus Altiarchaeota archaeon]
MISGKGEYLRRLTSGMRIRSVEVGKELDGSTPPSVFIGSWNYPKVFAGPMIAPSHGDTSMLDMPESWIPGGMSTDDIVNFRLNLVRGKQTVGITELDGRLAERLRDIALSDGSVESEAVFVHAPRGTSFNDDHPPHGPSALMESFDVGNCRWDHHLEKSFYDTDLRAADAVRELYDNEVPFSRIQKAFSVGAFGFSRKRKLVPTRWSITACDSALGNQLLEEVRHYPVIEGYRVYEFNSLHNHYSVILLPTAWQFEWMEAFLHILGREEMLFSDFERNCGKKGYSSVGGCYYSCRFAVLEALARLGRQAGAIVLREAYEGYVPLGVFNVRENVRHALAGPGLQFNSFRVALEHAALGLRLPLARFIRSSTLFEDHLTGRQRTLASYV